MALRITILSIKTHGEIDTQHIDTLYKTLQSAKSLSITALNKIAQSIMVLILATLCTTTLNKNDIQHIKTQCNN